MNWWVRLWLDMPTDPKWRVIAQKSGRSISEVIAVFNFMLICAGNAARTQTNANERGELRGWSCEDVAAALDLKTESVSQIYNAMEGKIIKNDRLIAWEKRQPLREDGSAERAKAWRERNRTQPNATERPDTDTDTDTEDKKESSLRSESSVSRKPIRARKRKIPNSRIEYPPDFERFWRGYPTDSNMSKAEALREWEKLDAVDREAAERSLTGFRAYCSKNTDYRPVHAIRYLKLRRFDGHISTNGHDGTAPALSEKDAAFRWWMDQGMSREKAEERWEMILQRRQQHG